MTETGASLNNAASTPHANETTHAINKTFTPPPRYTLPPDAPSSLARMFLDVAPRHARPDALNFKREGQWRPISSDEMRARARAIALGLYALGLRQGERAALLSDNCPEWTLTDAGCQIAGVIDVPIYATQAPAQVCYILNDSQSRVLFIQNFKAYERVREAICDCSSVEKIVFFDTPTDAERDARFMTLAELEARGRRLDEEQPTLADSLAEAVASEDLATIIYTSGTTGEPKGVMLTHANLISNYLAVADRLRFPEENSTKDIALSILPLSHIFERNAMYMFLHFGVAVFYAESIEKLGGNLREVRPTLMDAVPRLYEKIYARIQERAAAGGKAKTATLAWAIRVGNLWARKRSAGDKIPLSLSLQHKLATKLVFSKWHEALGGRLRLSVVGGAALPADLGYTFWGAGVTVLHSYGLTETSPGITVNEPQTNRVETVGRPLRDIEVRLAEDGEIEVRGPNIMRGYYNKPEATKEVFTADGWFKTGDIGTIDADGYLKITDRKKEMFKTSGGKYLTPQPIEQRLKQSRFVSQVVLVGNGRKFPAALIFPNMEQLRSYVRLKNINVANDDEIRSHPQVLDLMQRQVDELCKEMGKYERVKRIALLPRELTIEGGELTPTLKIKRRVVDEKYKDLIDKIYADAEADGHKTEA